MAPQNVAQMLDNSHLETLFDKFLQYLLRNKIVTVGKKENLSLSQLKTIYNLNCKYQEEFSTRGSIVEFEDLQQVAISKQKLIMQKSELIFPSIKIVTFNSNRSNLAEILDSIANNNQQSEVEFLKEKSFRHSLDSKKLIFAAKKFPVGYQKNLIENLIQEKNPAIFCGFNCNFKEETQIKDIHLKGFAPFMQNVNTLGGGLILHINRFLEPKVAVPGFESKDHEAIWVEFNHPEIVEKKRPKIYCGMAAEDSNNSKDFYDYLKNVVWRKVYDCDFLLIVHYTNKARMELFKSQLGGLLEARFVNLTQNSGFLMVTGGKIFQSVKLSTSEGFTLFLESVRLKCEACKEAFLSEGSMQEHRSSLRHKRNFYSHWFQSERLTFISDKKNVTINLEGPADIAEFEESSGTIRIRSRPNVPVHLKLSIKNLAPKSSQRSTPDTKRKLGVIATMIATLAEGNTFQINDEYNISKLKELRDERVRGGIRINNEKAYKFEVKCQHNEIGLYRMPLFVSFMYEEDDGVGTQTMQIAREIILKVTNSDVDFIKPIQPFERPKPVSKRHIFLKVEPGMPIEKEGKPFKPTWKLDHYMIKDALKRVLKSGRSELNEDNYKDYKEILGTPLCHEHYYRRFALMMHCEEFQMELDIRNYDMEKVKMVASGKYLKLDVPGLAENRPSVLKGDKIYAQLYLRNGDVEPTEYEGIVHMVEDSSVVIGFSKKLRDRFLPNMLFNIRFTFNRFPLRNMHRAAEFMALKPDFKHFVFPQNTLSQDPDPEPAQRIKFFNDKVESNPEQNLAVTNIVKGGVSGIPYIIFGPPGTGKTVTITEAIKQIWKTKTEAYIVAAAPSNSAADLLAEHLIKQVPKTQILRYYAPSRLEKLVPAKVKDISNFHPSRSALKMDDLVRFRIIVVTLVTAGKLASAGFPEDHFTHLFIDEAGHATEPEAVIPLAGILSKKGQLVLAGDPKQLGPVLRSPIALKFGLQVSLLERLMNTSEVYKRDEDEMYPVETITKLLNNFRSHPKLLHLPSKLFYDNELKPKADEFVTHSMLNWSELPNKKVPLIFHGIVGDDQREAKSPSFFNPEEAAKVVEYVQNLLDSSKGIAAKVKPEEIGVISPYRRQVHKIRELMNKKFQNKFPEWKKINVGSTEEFQGQERRIIIISTVRSKPTLLQADYEHKLGFLNNPKRFNVAISRAKALMVVIGNPYLLSMDHHWKELLRFTLDNNCYKGIQFTLPKENDELDDGFMDVGKADIIARNEIEIMEQKFKEMGIKTDSASENDKEINFGSFEDLNDISHQEYQQSLPFRNDI